VGVGVAVPADGDAPVPPVAVALGETLGEAWGAAPADAERTDGGAVADAVPGAAEADEEGTDAVCALCPGAAAADDSPAVRFVRLGPPGEPSAGDEEEEEERPMTSASTDAAPTAPAAATTGLPRRPPAPRAFRRRSARPGPGTAGATLGSSRVSSYALSQPCAAAGSRYSS
jgi:hypothetical protein